MSPCRCLLGLLAFAAALSNLVGQSGSTPSGARLLASYDGAATLAAGLIQPREWKRWTPRDEIAPLFSVDPKVGLGSGGALKLEGNRVAGVHGAWERRVETLAAGRSYLFTAHYRINGVPDSARSVSARIDWLDSKGNRSGPPDFTSQGIRQGDWVRIEHRTVAPAGTTAAVLRLSLLWAPGGTVWWDGIRLEEVAPPRARVVRVMTVNHRPQRTASAAASLEEFCRLAEESAGQKPDIVCLPEGATLVGTGKVYYDVAEPIPGPSTARLGATARRLHSYVVAGIVEKAGSLIYNTAVLIDRDGKLAGSYRKTHLPYEEVEGGITPGDSYPVFETDFGRIAMLICWDLQFPEPWRAVASRGAELVLLPIWGGFEPIAIARAMENSIYLVSSSYDMKSFIVDPAGTVLGHASKDPGVATAEIDLDRKIIQPWIGDMKTRTWKERRTDLPVR